MRMDQQIRAALLRALHARDAEMTDDLREAIVSEIERSFAPAASASAAPYEGRPRAPVTSAADYPADWHEPQVLPVGKSTTV